MKIVYSQYVKKKYKKLPKTIQNQFDTRILLFQENKNHPLLHNHSLQGEYDGCWSINVTGDYRAIYYYTNESTVFFITIGTHSELYS
jgi:addiction module RelE/StbE family toxin